MEKTENAIFWTEEKGKVKISQSKLISFLEEKGFCKIKLSETTDLLVEVQNNVISKTSIQKMTLETKHYLQLKKKWDVLEIFSKGVGNYLNNSKLNLLKVIEVESDRDDYDTARFFFKNIVYEVNRNGLSPKSYNELKFPIWKSRIIGRDIDFEGTKGNKGQFQQFCEILSKNDKSRMKSLMSILGYLIHRNRERGEDKAIILYDEKMSMNELANGGTGKTLLCSALSFCREVVMFDGKEIKRGSWFKNQRIEISSDILAYDDLEKGTSLEAFFTSLTSGIEVEKKRQQSFMIPYELMPKIVFTSNYYINGPGGSSDARRRHEFEVANFFDDKKRPEDYFGNRFFGREWGSLEWRYFYLFMMRCVETYLRNGLTMADSINLSNTKAITNTSSDFVEFADSWFESNTWYNKKEIEADYTNLFEESITPHQFKKWLDDYAKSKGMELETKSQNSKYKFRLKTDSETVRK
jgi:hypothetical protein